MHRPLCSDRLPVKYRSSIGQVSAKHRSRIGKVSVKYRSSIDGLRLYRSTHLSVDGRLLADYRSNIGPLSTNISVDYRSAIGRLSTDISTESTYSTQDPKCLRQLHVGFQVFLPTAGLFDDFHSYHSRFSLLFVSFTIFIHNHSVDRTSCNFFLTILLLYTSSLMFCTFQLKC